jgi:hypothetical protein
MLPFVRRFIVPLGRKYQWKSVCEIGASTGRSTTRMLSLPIVNYTIIDPCLDEDLPPRFFGDQRVNVIKRNSLDALTSCDLKTLGAPFDCILIDGDHNWYTVFNELHLIHERDLLRSGGYIFFHDVGWPYGYRDMYYQPDTIPDEFRLPFAHLGIVEGRSELADSGGFAAEYANAIHEGGPRNGVCCAIEDFISRHRGNYRFFKVDYEYGLGVMQRRPAAVRSGLAFYWIRIKSRFVALVARRRYRRALGWDHV